MVRDDIEILNDYDALLYHRNQTWIALGICVSVAFIGGVIMSELPLFALIALFCSGMMGLTCVFHFSKWLQSYNVLVEYDPDFGKVF